MKQLNIDKALRQEVIDACDDYLTGNESTDVDHVYYGTWGDLYGKVIGYGIEYADQDDDGLGTKDELLRKAYKLGHYEEPLHNSGPEFDKAGSDFLDTMRECKDMLL